MAFYKGGTSTRRKSLAEMIRNREADLTFIPPHSPRVIMTDRGDGKLWNLAFNTTDFSADGLGYISIINPPPERPDLGNFVVYGPFDGPLVRYCKPCIEDGKDPAMRLLIRDGFLGYEHARGNTTRQGLVLARQAVRHDIRQIILPASWVQEGDLLGWRNLLENIGGNLCK